MYSNGEKREIEYEKDQQIGDWKVKNEFGKFVLQNECEDGYIKRKNFRDEMEKGKLLNGKQVGIWKTK